MCPYVSACMHMFVSACMRAVCAYVHCVSPQAWLLRVRTIAVQRRYALRVASLLSRIPAASSVPAASRLATSETPPLVRGSQSEAADSRAARTSSTTYSKVRPGGVRRGQAWGAVNGSSSSSTWTHAHIIRGIGAVAAARGLMHTSLEV